MKRFYILGGKDEIVAEGVLFSSGAVSVSFLPTGSGVAVNPNIQRARYQHVTLGNRVIAWLDDLTKDDDADQEMTLIIDDVDWERVTQKWNFIR